MCPERVPGTERANPTMVSPSNAPMTCPPTLSATTNIRSGTNSASVKFQTSFCSATHARKSSIPWQRRSSTGMLFRPEQRRGTQPARLAENSLAAGGSRGFLLLLLSLGALPQGLEFIHGGLIRRAPGLLQPFLHPLKTALELPVGLAQRRLGIHR